LQSLPHSRQFTGQILEAEHRKSLITNASQYFGPFAFRL